MTPFLPAASAIALVFALTACATTADSPKAGTAKAMAQNPACLSQTGSRTAGNDANCSAFGRSYSSDDISRTGSTTAGEALRLMDPSITVHH